MAIELDKIALIMHIRDQDSGATKLLNSIHNISISDNRCVVEHRIPGLEGSILQDMGREPVKICFDGLIFGENALDSMKKIREKFKAGEPIPFNSDITGVAEVTQVMIEKLEIEETGGTVNTYKYSMVLREYIPPPEEEEVTPSQEEEAEEATEEKADDDLSSINYIAGRVLDEDGNPEEGVDVKITYDGGEYALKTDKDGLYRKDELDPGKYTVTVDAPGYEDMKEEVEIKSKEKKS